MTITNWLAAVRRSLVAALQGIQQVPHPRGRHGQRPGPPRDAQPEIEFQLPGRHPLPRGSSAVVIGGGPE
jgi:hypothetical protein